MSFDRPKAPVTLEEALENGAIEPGTKKGCYQPKRPTINVWASARDNNFEVIPTEELEAAFPSNPVDLILDNADEDGKPKTVFTVQIVSAEDKILGKLTQDRGLWRYTYPDNKTTKLLSDDLKTALSAILTPDSTILVSTPPPAPSPDSKVSDVLATAAGMAHKAGETLKGLLPGDKDFLETPGDLANTAGDLLTKVGQGVAMAEAGAALVKGLVGPKTPLPPVPVDVTPTHEVTPDNLVSGFPAAFVEKMRRGERVEVMFVCTGNFNRSPALELLTKQAVGAYPRLQYVSVRSRGTKEWRGTGHGINPCLTDVMPEGAFLTSQQLTAVEAAEADLFLAVADSNADILQDKYGISPERIIVLPKVLYSGNVESLYDPQTIMGSGTSTQEEKMAATERMLEELRSIVDKGIIPALNMVASTTTVPNLDRDMSLPIPDPINPVPDIVNAITENPTTVRSTILKDGGCISNDPEAIKTYPFGHMAAFTNKGEKYSDHNEDRVVINEVLDENGAVIGVDIFVIDGIGGHGGGERAAEIFAEECKNCEDIVEMLNRIHAKLNADPTTKKEGGVCWVALRVRGNKARLARMGDARGTLWTSVGHHPFNTPDEGPAYEDLAKGMLTLNDTRYYVTRNQVSNALQAGYGYEFYLATHTWTFDLMEGDVISLRTDGITDNFTEDEEMGFMEGLTAQEAMSQLFKKCTARMVGTYKGPHKIIHEKPDNLSGAIYIHGETNKVAKDKPASAPAPTETSTIPDLDLDMSSREAHSFTGLAKKSFPEGKIEGDFQDGELTRIYKIKFNNGVTHQGTFDLKSKMLTMGEKTFPDLPEFKGVKWEYGTFDKSGQLSGEHGSRQYHDRGYESGTYMTGYLHGLGCSRTSKDGTLDEGEFKRGSLWNGTHTDNKGIITQFKEGMPVLTAQTTTPSPVIIEERPKRAATPPPAPKSTPSEIRSNVFSRIAWTLGIGGSAVVCTGAAAAIGNLIYSDMSEEDGSAERAQFGNWSKRTTPLPDGEAAADELRAAGTEAIFVIACGNGKIKTANFIYYTNGELPAFDYTVDRKLEQPVGFEKISPIPPDLCKEVGNHTWQYSLKR